LDHLEIAKKPIRTIGKKTKIKPKVLNSIISPYRRVIVYVNVRIRNRYSQPRSAVKTSLRQESIGPEASAAGGPGAVPVFFMEVVLAQFCTKWTVFVEILT
jgi:hypothetical protein